MIHQPKTRTCHLYLPWVLLECVGVWLYDVGWLPMLMFGRLHRYGCPASCCSFSFVYHQLTLLRFHNLVLLLPAFPRFHWQIVSPAYGWLNEFFYLFIFFSISFPLSGSFNYSGAWIYKPNPREPIVHLPPQQSPEAARTVLYICPREREIDILPPKHTFWYVSSHARDMESKVWNILLK